MKLITTTGQQSQMQIQGATLNQLNQHQVHQAMAAAGGIPQQATMVHHHQTQVHHTHPVQGHHHHPQLQTIQIAGPGGHPNTIQVVTSQPGQPTFQLQQGSTIVGHTTIGGQTIQIQQPTVVSSIPQQIHFATPGVPTVAASTAVAVQQQHHQQQQTVAQIQKPQQTSKFVLKFVDLGLGLFEYIHDVD